MILVIGQNGFLGSTIRSLPETPGIRFSSHGDVSRTVNFDGVTSVINLAVDPRYMTEDYDEAYDYELRIGRLVAESDIHYVMASSRKVYAPDVLMGAAETDLATGVDAYGRSKRRTEIALENILGQRLTVLRLGNVIGFDLQWSRPTLISRMLTTLKREGRITLDINKDARRDFITDRAVADILVRSAEQRVAGTFNVGSGVPLPIGKIAEWLIESYGSGELVVKSTEVRDEFVLDTTKLNAEFGPVCSVEDIRSTVVETGRRLLGV